MPNRVLTINDFRNIMAKKAIKGEVSMPKRKAMGRILRIGAKIGSVVLNKNSTIGLKGSGLTQLIKALMSISQYKIVKTTSTTCAKAAIKLDKINMPLYSDYCQQAQSFGIYKIYRLIYSSQ
jgi:hypothetical protein